MTKGGGKRHLKRFVVSKHIPIEKKANTYTVRPSPGPHAAHDCIPMAIMLRDMFQVARNMSEVKRILVERNVLVDGRTKTNRKYPLGFMDVISFPKIKEHYRLIYTPKKGLRTIPIKGDETKVKLCQIKNKTTLKGGLTQLNLHDGRNIILQKKESELKIGNYGIVTSGRWMGKHGTIEEISSHGKQITKTATIRTPDGEVFVTLFRYIFIVGNDAPCVTIAGNKGDKK
jgi:small subunit ribosomal protein S4e